MTYFEKIVDFFGLDLLEPFKIFNFKEEFRFQEEGLYWRNEGDFSKAPSYILDALLSKNTKIDFKPEIGETYYAPNWDSQSIWVEPWVFQDELWDDSLYKNHLIYKTEYEAWTNLYSDYKKVTGKEWEKKN